MYKIKEKLIDILKRRKSNIYVTITIVVIITTYLFIEIKKNQIEDLVINEYSLKSKKNRICVYLDGEVNKPGIYYLKEFITLKEVLDCICGVTDDAALNKVDLNKVLKDGTKIVIPKKYN